MIISGENKVSENLYLITGIFMMIIASYNISRLYNIEQKDVSRNIKKTDKNNYSGRGSMITEMHRQAAAIFYIAAFCVPAVTISITASILGNSQMAVGIIIGSNITLILLCRGVNYMTKNIRRIMNGDIMYLSVVSVIFLFLANDTMFNGKNSLMLITSSDALILIILGLSYIILKMWKSMSIIKSNEDFDEEILNKSITCQISEENSQNNLYRNTDVNSHNKNNINQNIKNDYKNENNIISAKSCFYKIIVIVKETLQQIKYKKSLIIFIIMNIAGAVLYAWNITETSLYYRFGQTRTNMLISGTILMVLLITVYYTAKNVDSVEKIVDNKGLLVQKRQKNVEKQEKIVQSGQKNVENKKFYLQREMENVDKIEESSIILIGIIELTFALGVSGIIQDIQVPISAVKNIVFLCAMYIAYCLMSNLTSRWDRIKGSIMITCFIAYIVYNFLFM